MCGFLIYEERPSAAAIDMHLEANYHRGEDGYGILAVATGNTMKALSRDVFMRKLPKFLESNEGGFVVHHRLASIGGITEALVHPLKHTDEAHGDVLVMQNGTRKELATLFYAQSDTAALAEIWHGISDDLLYLILEGSGVVFVRDKRGLYFHRDSGRSLYYSPDHKMWASEPVECGTWYPAQETCLAALPDDVSKWADDDYIGVKANAPETWEGSYMAGFYNVVIGRYVASAKKNKGKGKQKAKGVISAYSTTKKQPAAQQHGVNAPYEQYSSTHGKLPLR